MNQQQIIKNVRDAVSILGGPEAAGRRLGRTRQAVQNWIDRGAIAAVARPKVDAALEGKGYIAHPSIYRRDRHSGNASRRAN